MLKELIYKNTKDKKVLILGFGKEGQSTLRLLREILPDQLFSIADKDVSLEKSSDLIKSDGNLKLILGEKYLDHLDDFDFIIKSPGIPLLNANIFINKTKISSQTDLFINAYSNQIIGITGTKGKSTTTSLLFHLLQQNSDNVIISGNIGIPPFEVESKINNSSIILLELSAHQLESISASPKTSIILNIYPEHLDHFNGFDKYKTAKLNITKFQKSGDNLIIPMEDTNIQASRSEVKKGINIFEYSLHRRVKQGCFRYDNSIVFASIKGNQTVLSLKKELPLPGEHNLLNIMAAINAAMIYGLPIEYINKGILTFQALEHRMEFAGKFKEVSYYNDSISTIPESTIYALKSIKNVKTLILGGFDRGIDYDNLIRFIINSKLENIILTGSVGQRIFEGLNKNRGGHQKLHFTESFVEAIKIAGKVTGKGSTCLFSPAAASYDQFKNFEERGELFKELISKSL